MRCSVLLILLGLSAAAWAQTTDSSGSVPSNPANQDSRSPQATKPAASRTPNLAPPRSDSVNAAALGDEPGESSSKDTIIDLSPPDEDLKAHPGTSKNPTNEDGSGDVAEFHPWDPHKAAKDVEIGDFYFKRKNYVAAESRYREALKYKDNDAVATFRLATCLEKMNRSDEAREEYENYLKILPGGPEAERARKAIQRLQTANRTPVP
jgi:tetratricopeptide (TPR) repeat protein